MSDYKLYKNRKTIGPRGEEHPSIDLGINNNRWENLEVTSSKTNKDTFIELDVNPNPNLRDKNNDGSNKHPSYVRKYVRKDNIYDKLSEFKKYRIEPCDAKKIDDYLEQRKINIEIDKKRREEARQRKKDAKLRYHLKGRSASIRISGQASLPISKTPFKNQVNKKKKKRW